MGSGHALYAGYWMRSQWELIMCELRTQTERIEGRKYASLGILGCMPQPWMAKK